MSIFSTLDFVTIESSSFHNSIPNLIYVSRRFCIHVILSWRPKNCTGALKNWNLGEKKPVYCLSLISKSYNLSSFEPSLMHVQEGVFKLLYWPNNACSVNWLIYQPTDRWNQYILFSRGGHNLSDMFLPIGVLFVYDQIFLNVVSQIF